MWQLPTRAALRYSSFPCSIASLIGHICVTFKLCCPFFFPSPLLTFQSPFLNHWHREITLTKHFSFPPVSQQIAAVFLCFWKTPLVACIIRSYQVSGLHVHWRNLTGKDWKRKKSVTSETGRGMHPLWYLFFGFFVVLPSSSQHLRRPLPQLLPAIPPPFTPRKQKHKLACLNSFALHGTCSILIKMRSVTKEIWRPLMSRWMGIIAVNRPMNLAEASTGQQRRKHMQANKQMNPHKASFLLHPPLHLGCSASRVIFFFFLPQFLCLFFSPICCVWTWPLGANSLPWTPSAVWLSTVNWARLVVSGRDRGCVVTCSACRLLPPGIIFHRRLPGSRERVWRKKAVCQSISTSHVPEHPGRIFFQFCSSVLHFTFRKDVKMSLHGLFSQHDTKADPNPP